MPARIMPVIVLVMWLFGGTSTLASPLTFYWDEAEWLQAVSGYQVGTYPYSITRTDYVWILDYDPHSGPSVVGLEINLPGWWSNGSFQPTFFADFFSAGSYIDVSCWDIPCQGVPDLASTVIHFETPIYGFAGYGQIFARIDGAFVDQSGFFGVTGIGDTLDFDMVVSIDDPLRPTYLENIVIAFQPVPEPSSIALLFAALSLSPLVALPGSPARGHRRRSPANSLRTDR